MPDNIGRWAHRYGTLDHYVESEVADRLVMGCGKEIAERDDRPWAFEDTESDEACYYCQRAYARRVAAVVAGLART